MCVDLCDLAVFQVEMGHAIAAVPCHPRRKRPTTYCKNIRTLHMLLEGCVVAHMGVNVLPNYPANPSELLLSPSRL